MPDSSIRLAVDPDRVAAAALASRAAAELVAGWDLAADLGPMTVALPDSAAAAVAASVGQAWAERLRGVRTAALAESARLVDAGGAYRWAEEATSADIGALRCVASAYAASGLPPPSGQGADRGRPRG
ncbi:MAG: hypothetical protein M3Z83_09510 [Actinomycetota bacterium]|nr:hypothetical protein [Actinomycetota bacterium]